jgi:hypothetical protein
MGTPLGKHGAAARGCHPGAESVTALAHQLARLIGPLHGSFSAFLAAGDAPSGRQIGFKARLEAFDLG